MAFIFVEGPEVSKVSRKVAEQALRERDDVPEDADIAVAELKGSWVAAIHTAEFPPPSPEKGGGPADSDEKAPSPKSESPDDVEPSLDDGDGDDDSDDLPGEEHSDKEEKHEDGQGKELHEVVSLLHTLFEGLGLPLPGDLGGSPVPGDDGPPGGPPGLGGPPPPPAGGPPPGGPKGGPGGPPGNQHQIIEHKRGLKPGEVPPGATPIGSPSFSHVTKDGSPHPWAPALGKKATFEVKPERIPDHYTAEAVEAELRYLADGTGYKVKQVNIETDPETGHRIARALISRR